jgi:hypothetical protein
MKRAHVYALLFVVVASWPAAASAHPTRTAFRIGLGIPLLSVTHYPGPEETELTYGLWPVTLGLHLGVQVTNEIGIALNVYGGGRWNDSPAGEADYVMFSAMPRFEYMFTPHGTVAPYLGAEIGGAVEGDPDANLRDVFRTGGFFGLHIFAETEVSIDLELAASFVYDIDRGEPGVRAIFALSTTGWLR